MFAAIREGRAEVVTDHIAHFTATGIQLQSGAHLEADIVIMATGLNLKFAGGVEYKSTGAPIDFTEHSYRGMMFSDLPNMAFTVGYTNSSWTLKVDLTANYVCRLLNHMKKHGMRVMPRLKGTVEQEPLDFDAGYVLRSRNQFPKQGNRLPWKNYQNYIRDFISLRLESFATRSWSSSNGAVTADFPSGSARLSRILCPAYSAANSSCRL